MPRTPTDPIDSLDEGRRIARGAMQALSVVAQQAQTLADEAHASEALNREDLAEDADLLWNAAAAVEQALGTLG